MGIFDNWKNTMDKVLQAQQAQAEMEQANPAVVAQKPNTDYDPTRYKQTNLDKAISTMMGPGRNAISPLIVLLKAYQQNEDKRSANNAQKTSDNTQAELGAAWEQQNRPTTSPASISGVGNSTPASNSEYFNKIMQQLQALREQDEKDKQDIEAINQMAEQNK